MTTVARIAIVVALLFGTVALGAVLVPSNPEGAECGLLFPIEERFLPESVDRCTYTV